MFVPIVTVVIAVFLFVMVFAPVVTVVIAVIGWMGLSVVILSVDQVTPYPDKRVLRRYQLYSVGFMNKYRHQYIGLTYNIVSWKTMSWEARELIFTIVNIILLYSIVVFLNYFTRYDEVSVVVENQVHWRSDFQIGSRVLKRVLKGLLSISMISCRKVAENTQNLENCWFRFANWAPELRNDPKNGSLKKRLTHLFFNMDDIS